MSFILNALKKSEKERQLYENPHLHVVHGCPPSFKRNIVYNHRRRNVLILAVMLAMGSSAGVYAFRSKFYGLEVSHVSPTEDKVQMLVPNVPPDRSKKVPVISHNLTVKRNLSGHTIAINNEIMFVDSLPKKQDRTLLPEFKDLPGSLQAAIPELHCAGHTYSTEPEKRMIIINNSILREGEKIDENLRLVEITWDGLIIEFNGERFIKRL